MTRSSRRMIITGDERVSIQSSSMATRLATLVATAPQIDRPNRDLMIGDSHI
ncbi:MAG: hypothetical protein ACRENK_00410 [Gemmatimonadaceae bacterium]